MEFFWGSYFNSKNEFKELFFRSQNNPPKGVILYLKFLLHFWGYNNYLKITVYVYKSMLNERWITLLVVYSRPFASKALFWAILKEFEFAVYCS